MRKTPRTQRGILAILAVLLVTASVWAGRQADTQTKKANVVLPAAVAQAVKANFPGAEIKTAGMEKEAGINLYDIEFKADKGEIEIAEDGTVMDVAVIVGYKDVPREAAKAMHAAAPGAAIRKIERSEIRAEIKKEGDKGRVVKLAAPKFVFEAEVHKGEQSGEIQVAPDGTVVEALKWAAKKESAEENEEAEEAPAGQKSPDLKILPAAVLNAFKAAYPNAVIKGASKESEKGVTYYEVESVDGKLNRDLLYTVHGKAAEIEETVPPENLPAAVQQSLAKAHPGCKILKAEAMTKGTQKMFELQILVNNKTKSITIDPSGKIMK
jgi:uncharacterized membrane protein YkoI